MLGTLHATGTALPADAREVRATYSAAAAFAAAEYLRHRAAVSHCVAGAGRTLAGVPRALYVPMQAFSLFSAAARLGHLPAVVNEGWSDVPTPSPPRALSSSHYRKKAREKSLNL
jgi:hypothetical protein